MPKHWLRRFEGGRGSPSGYQLEKALVLLGYDFGYHEDRDHARRDLTAFKQRWGDFSTTTLLAVARRFVPRVSQDPTADNEAQTSRTEALDPATVYWPQTHDEVDTHFALATLGVLRPPEAPEALLPYLAGSCKCAQERWLAAFGLAAMHDERVLPTIGCMLLEFVGPYHPQIPDGSLVHLFQGWHGRLPQMLADWGDPRVVPLLRTALMATVDAEAVAVPEPQGPESEFMSQGKRYTGAEAWREFCLECRRWVDEEHRLIYALGRLGAFGALVGIHARPGIYHAMPAATGEELNLIEKVPSDHAAAFRANVWRVHACLGALELSILARLGTVYSFSDVPELAEAVERLLEGRFGLDTDVRHQAMEAYDQASYVFATVRAYQRITERDRSDDEREDAGGSSADEEFEELKGEAPEPDDPPEISLEDREEQDCGW